MENCIGKNKRNLSNKLYESQQVASQETFEGYVKLPTRRQSADVGSHNRKIPAKHRMLSGVRYQTARLNRENL